MGPQPTTTDEIFAAFLKCRYKAHLKLAGPCGDPSEYEKLQARLSADYRAAARSELLRRHAGASVVVGDASLPEAIRGGAEVITGVTPGDAGESCRLDALEKVGDRGPGAAASYRPVLFVRHEKVTADHRLLLAFGASILARVQGSPLPAGGSSTAKVSRPPGSSWRRLRRRPARRSARSERSAMPPRPRRCC